MAIRSGDIERVLTVDVRARMAAAIADTGGNEVFFLLRRSREEGAFDDVEVLARGNRHAVPALLHAPGCGDAVAHNHPSGNLQPSDPDLALASHYGQDGVAFFIVNNTADDIYIVVEPAAGPRSELSAVDVADSFSVSGPLAAMHPGFEPRPDRQQLPRGVHRR